MTENIQASIKHEVSLSMKEGNKFRTVTLRLIVSAVKDAEIAGRSKGQTDIKDSDIVSLLKKMIKLFIGVVFIKIILKIG